MGFQKVPRTPPWRVRPLRRAPYVGSSSDEEDLLEPSDSETRSEIAKPSKGSPQTVPNNTGKAGPEMYREETSPLGLLEISCGKIKARPASGCR